MAEVEAAAVDGLDGFGGRRCAYVTVAQFAEYFGISRPFAYKLIAAGLVPAVRLGEARRVRKSAIRAIEAAGGLEAYLAQDQAAAGDADE